jgi:DNA-binding NarL/FixJ family response regulator
MPSSPVKILIADDSPLIRSKLAATLSTRGDWIVCGQAADGREAVMLAVEQKPDFIILDFSMPMLSGILAAAEILKVMPTLIRSRFFRTTVEMRHPRADTTAFLPCFSATAELLVINLVTHHGPESDSEF